MISVEAVGSVVRVEVAGCKVDLSIGEARSLSIRLDRATLQAVQAAYRQGEEARREELRIASEEAGKQPGIVVIDGVAWRWFGSRQYWQRLGNARGVRGEWEGVDWGCSDPPPSWPTIRWFRTSGGRRLHAWRGGRSAVCGQMMHFRDGDGSRCRRCEAILSAETPTTDAPSLGSGAESASGHRPAGGPSVEEDASRGSARVSGGRP